MGRIKIVLQIPQDDPSAFTRQSRKFYRDLNEALRFSSGGAEWVVPGPTRTSGANGTERRQVDRQFLCEIKDLEQRWPVIEELIHEYGFTEEAVVYREEGLNAGWERVWPAPSN